MSEDQTTEGIDWQPGDRVLHRSRFREPRGGQVVDVSPSGVMVRFDDKANGLFDAHWFRIMRETAAAKLEPAT